MMNYISFLVQVTGLLVVLSGDNVNAEVVEGANLDSKRDLIGFGDMLDIQSSQNQPEVRLDPEIEESPTPAPEASAPVVPGAPTKFPTKPPTPFPTRGEPSAAPSTGPSDQPSLAPSVSSAPTAPTASPTEDPTPEPSSVPSPAPSETPDTPAPSETAGDEVGTISGRGRQDDPDSLQTISEIICDKNNAYLWKTLCDVLEEVEGIELLGDIEAQYTLFAPTNEAFENSDYTLDSLLEDESALRNLLFMHIAPSILPYDALLCDLSTEMLNSDVSKTLCVGDVRAQSADGNEVRNLPIIEGADETKAMNGIIHTVNNLILPFEFALDNDLVDIPNSNSGNITESDTTLTSAIDSLNKFIANRGEIVLDGDGNSCQVCKSRELCTIPRSATVLVPGEGKVACINVLNRQNTGRGIIMGPNMCKALQQRFNDSCLIGN